MSKPIETLMTEHRLIEQVLGSMETFVERMDRGEDVPRSVILNYADFLRNFADKCHHGKEEDRLFVRMTEFGFPREYGPIAVMLAEHVESRAHVKALFEVAAESGPLTAEERLQVSKHALAYIPLLRAHIQKEDNILYPMALQSIPPSELEALGASFEEFERKEMGEGTHEKFHALAEALIGAFPPDPAKMAAGAACMSCAGHM